ncbi:unnamed protein product [Allacma fusca]|uniref:Uncharacterized protein n=1 Tax=Allacma fusca TaxID=39272 RepID=A0A8J2NYR3_9HEXA|nr:unnamed protein product [Allacma fusca]
MSLSYEFVLKLSSREFKPASIQALECPVAVAPYSYHCCFKNKVAANGENPELRRNLGKYITLFDSDYPSIPSLQFTILPNTIRVGSN